MFLAQVTESYNDEGCEQLADHSIPQEYLNKKFQ